MRSVQGPAPAQLRALLPAREKHLSWAPRAHPCSPWAPQAPAPPHSGLWGAAAAPTAPDPVEQGSGRASGSDSAPALGLQGASQPPQLVGFGSGGQGDLCFQKP